LNSSNDKQIQDGAPAAMPPSTESSDGGTADTVLSRRMHWLRRLLPVVFLAIVTVLAARELRGLDIHSVHAVLQAVTPSRLLIIQLIAVAGVLSMGLYDWHAARVLNLPIALPTLMRNAWIANTFNNLIGFSGLAGSGIRMLLLDRDGIDVRRAAAFSALIMASVPAGLAVLSWPLLLSGAAGTDRLPIPPWTAWLVVGAFAAYLPVFVLALYKGLFSRLLSGLTRQSRSSLAQLLAISTLDWLLAASVAWAALEFSGAAIPWPQFLFGFVLASTLGILSLIPGGLGVFDAALVAVLSPFATGPEHLVSGILLYRLCYYLVPWIIAVYLGADKLMLPRFWQQSALARELRESSLTALLRLPMNVLASLGVRMLAYLSFGGGVVLLASAAFPTLSGRLSVLRDYVPLAAIEISHLLSVATGVLLIALSRGIAEQVRSAYYLTQALLIGGAVLSVLKGIDYEEAITLLTVALLLKRQQGRFYRESYPLLSPRSLVWLAGLVAAVIGYAWLGDWVHGDIPLGWEHLSRFTHTQEAPRFARGLLIAMAVATAFIGWSLYRSPKITPSKTDTDSLAEAEAVLNTYGGSEFAHLLFLGDKSLIWSPQRRSFIQYRQIRDRLIALGDPCGDADDFGAVILEFRDYADRHCLTPCFYEISEAYMHHFHDYGFALFKLGETAMVELASFSTAGKRGESVRYSVNRARRGGVEFTLLEQPIDEALWPQLRAISDAWLAEHDAAEKSFSLGNYNEAYLRHSPIAVVRANEHIVAFANLMPDYGKRVELSVDLMRYHPDAPQGTMDFLFVELIRYAQSRGYQYFNMGMAPLGGVGDTRFARAGEKVARLAFEFGNRLYNYKGLRSFKEKYHPVWRSAYLAYPVLTPLPVLLIDIAALIAGGYRRIFFKSD
jgi:phosphatidylglycerol lysyltransferase